MGLICFLPSHDGEAGARWRDHDAGRVVAEIPAALDIRLLG